MHFSITFLSVLVALGTINSHPAPFSPQELEYIETCLKTDFDVSLVQRLANGMFGEVYKAQQDEDFFAVKLSSSKHYTYQEFWLYLVEAEWDCLTVTTHPNIAQVYDYRQYGMHNFTVRATFSELLGPNLKHLQELSETSVGGGLPRSVVFQIAFQVSEALVHLHSLHVAHHDVKLENIVMVGRPVPHRDLESQLTQAHYKLIDLGLCQAYPTRDTMESEAYSGDLRYSSPEKHNTSKPYDAFRADAYALGCTLARALMGEPTRAAIMERINSDSEEQIAVYQMDIVYRLYREHCLTEGQQQDVFYQLVGQLLEPVETDRMTVDDFFYHLNQF